MGKYLSSSVHCSVVCEMFVNSLSREGNVNCASREMACCWIWLRVRGDLISRRSCSMKAPFLRPVVLFTKSCSFTTLQCREGQSGVCVCVTVCCMEDHSSQIRAALLLPPPPLPSPQPPTNNMYDVWKLHLTYIVVQRTPKTEEQVFGKSDALTLMSTHTLVPVWYKLLCVLVF